MSVTGCFHAAVGREVGLEKNKDNPSGTQGKEKRHTGGIFGLRCRGKVPILFEVIEVALIHVDLHKRLEIPMKQKSSSCMLILKTLPDIRDTSLQAGGVKLFKSGIHISLSNHGTYAQKN